MPIAVTVASALASALASTAKQRRDAPWINIGLVARVRVGVVVYPSDMVVLRYMWVVLVVLAVLERLGRGRRVLWCRALRCWCGAVALSWRPKPKRTWSALIPRSMK